MPLPDELFFGHVPVVKTFVSKSEASNQEWSLGPTRLGSCGVPSDKHTTTPKNTMREVNVDMCFVG
jgi:hypothetical protein